MLDYAGRLPPDIPDQTLKQKMFAFMLSCFKLHQLDVIDTVILSVGSVQSCTG